MCVRQASTQAPITWKTLSDPYAELGSTTRTDYTVQADVMLERSGYAELLGRVGGQELMNPGALNAYHLRVSDSGAWSVLRTNTSAQTTTLRSGTTAALGTGRWHSVALGFSGGTITATVDGVVVGTVGDSTLGAGLAGIGTTPASPARSPACASTRTVPEQPTAPRSSSGPVTTGTTRNGDGADPPTPVITAGQPAGGTAGR